LLSGLKPGFTILNLNPGGNDGVAYTASLWMKKFKIVPSAGSRVATAFSYEEVIFLVM